MCCILLCIPVSAAGTYKSLDRDKWALKLIFAKLQNVVLGFFLLLLPVDKRICKKKKKDSKSSFLFSGKTLAVCGEVERVPHGNLNMCHGPGLVYQGTSGSDLISAAVIMPTVWLWPQSIHWKMPWLLTDYFWLYHITAPLPADNTSLFISLSCAVLKPEVFLKRTILLIQLHERNMCWPLQQEEVHQCAH